MISDRVDAPIALMLAHLFDQFDYVRNDSKEENKRMKMNLSDTVLSLICLF
jgi:hypothetical protein